MYTRARRLGACMALLCLLNTTTAHAAPQADEHATTTLQDEVRQVAKKGPQDIALANQAVLHLPVGMAFVPQPQADKLLQSMGNPGTNPTLQGLVMPTSDEDWFMTVRFEDSGYVKDDDAKDWNADDLLKSYREGTEAANEERVKMGATPIEIVGWAQAPLYDVATHRLAWAMSSKEKDASDQDPRGVNYNTYALGRDGYFSMNLVTGLDELPQFKSRASDLLAALSYNDGKRYGDFNASTDHMAEYGLAALVVGVGAKKLGLLAMAGVFFAKFAKVILLGLAFLGSLATRIFRRKKAEG